MRVLSAHKRQLWGKGTEIQQALAEVFTSAANKSAAAAAILFSKLAVPGIGPAFSLFLWETPIASPGKSVRGPGEHDWLTVVASSRLLQRLIASS